MLKHVIWLGALLVAALPACGGSETPPPNGTGITVGAATPTPKAEEKPTASVEESSFRLAFEKSANYTSGQPGSVKVVLEPKGGWHVNQDYPIKVELKAPAVVKLQKPSLGKADAAAFSEQNARFDVGFTADKGSHEMLATVDFAVCTAETCLPDKRTIAVALDVQ